jgi:hypothetical protein
MDIGTASSTPASLATDAAPAAGGIPATTSASRNGHLVTDAVTPTVERTSSNASGLRAWFGDKLAHLETGLIVAIAVAPMIAIFVTVLAYVDPFERSLWRELTQNIPLVLIIPGNLLVVWFVLGLPIAFLRLGSADRANPASHGQLKNRLIGLEAGCATSDIVQDSPDANRRQIEAALLQQISYVMRCLAMKGSSWMVGSGYISLWRQLDHMDSTLNFILPTYRVWARAQGLLLRLPTASKVGGTGLPEQLTNAMERLANPATEAQARAEIAQIQLIVDASRTDRYSGLLRARNMLLAACTMTSLVLYALFWLGIVAARSTSTAPSLLGAALFFTTLGGLVGLFQLLYIDSQVDTGVDDYGLSLARVVVAPQVAGLAALVGVVLTSLTTATLSSTTGAANTIPVALEQIGRPANVVVAVAFALSPGMVMSRFRQRIEDTKRELTKSSGSVLNRRSSNRYDENS